MIKTALLLIDVQKGFNDPCWGKRNNPDFEKNTQELLTYSREMDWAIYLIQHCSTEECSPLRPNQPGFALMDIVSPRSGEEIITKEVNSAFIGTPLKERLDERNIKNLVIAGLTTDHCVSTTTRMAANYGYSVTLVADAVATFNKTDLDGINIPAEEVHRVNLASLKGEFAKIITTSELLGQGS